MKSNEFIDDTVMYFSYGMLCDPDIMDNLNADLVGVGYLRGYNLELYNHATIVKGSGGMYGCLWRIDSDTLAYLDRIEGYPNYYTRIVVPVQTSNETHNSWVYIMNQRYMHPKQIPDDEYVKTIAHGYRSAGVPLDQLLDALDSAEDRISNHSKNNKY